MELSNRLAQRGHDVTIYHSDGSPCNWMETLAKTAPAGDITRESHDVLIYNDPDPEQYRLAQATVASLKVFYILGLYRKELLSGLHPSLYWRSNRRTRYVKKCLQAPGLKLVNATWMKDWLSIHMGLDSTLLLGGVNQEMFHPVSTPRTPGIFQVLCSGDPRPFRGSESITEALQLARRMEPAIRVTTYYGRGVPQDQMAAVYSVADLFVEASDQGGWSNPVAEAMACRVPVVCTDIGAVQDFAFDGETARLVPVGDVQAMSQAILDLLRDEESRLQMAENGYRRICEFDWNDSAERLEQILVEQLHSGKCRQAA